MSKLKISDKTAQIAVAILDAILQMSDHAEAMGGSTCVSGIAALHKMQTSIQKNKARLLAALAADNRL